MILKPKSLVVILKPKSLVVILKLRKRVLLIAANHVVQKKPRRLALLIAASLAYTCAAVLTAWSRWSAAVTPASVAGQLRFRMQAAIVAPVVALLLHALLARGALNVVVAALVTHAWAAAFAFVARQAAGWTSSVGGMLLVGALDVRRYESAGGW